MTIGLLAMLGLLAAPVAAARVPRPPGFPDAA
jgi:hypothetical protein